MYVKLKASALLESLLAMLIIVTIFCLSFFVFANIIRSNNFSQRIQLKNLLNSYVFVAKQERIYLDEQIEIQNNITIVKKFIPYQNYADLILMEIIAINDKGKNIIGIKEIIKDETF